MQFRLPPGITLPPNATDVHISVEEGAQHADVMLGESLARDRRRSPGDPRQCDAQQEDEAKGRNTWKCPGVPEQTWQLDLSGDPDPTPGYSPWRFPGSSSAPKVEMNFHLGADR